MTTAAAADPLRKLGGTRRAYVVEPLKILYISTAKNACTSLKWLMAELAGEDLSRFTPELGPFLNDDEAIHRRDLYEKTPKLNEIPVATRRSISPANGWFVFSVVRDPRTRLFSAWQNKYLMHNPGYHRRWRDEDWYPATPESAQDVIESFARFVELIDKDPQHPVTNDSHFMTQTQLLSAQFVPYSKVYEIGELSKTFVTDLNEHLRAQGWTGEIALRKTNDSPLRANAAVFAGPVREQVERYFAPDFATYGHLWDFADIEAGPDWTPAMIDELRTRVALGERIGQLLVDLRRTTKELERTNTKLERTSTKLERATAKLDRANTKLAAAAATPTARRRKSSLRTRLGRRLPWLVRLKARLRSGGRSS
jgi:hypothetical protein